MEKQRGQQELPCPGRSGGRRTEGEELSSEGGGGHALGATDPEVPKQGLGSPCTQSVSMAIPKQMGTNSPVIPPSPRPHAEAAPQEAAFRTKPERLSHTSVLK